MTEIILARHGETEWNVSEIFRGRIDVELNDTGSKQAQLLAEYLSQKKIEAVYSSPLQRALRTAEVIARHHKLEVAITPGLIDLDFGKWQGLSHQEVKDKYAKATAKIKIKDSDFDINISEVNNVNSDEEGLLTIKTDVSVTYAKPMPKEK